MFTHFTLSHLLLYLSRGRDFQILKSDSPLFWWLPLFHCLVCPFTNVALLHRGVMHYPSFQTILLNLVVGKKLNIFKIFYLFTIFPLLLYIYSQYGNLVHFCRKVWTCYIIKLKSKLVYVKCLTLVTFRFINTYLDK